jgi:CRISPR-associated protein Csm4
MRFIKLTLKPKSAFGTPIMGDTLFGQLCWAFRNRYGEDFLKKILKGYVNAQPFAIISDAFPEGFIPRPTIPLKFFEQKTDIDRKRLKNLTWLPIENISQPVSEWLNFCKSDDQLFDTEKGVDVRRKIEGKDYLSKHIQPHNSINRLTGTTGEDGFAPFSMEQNWYGTSVLLNCFVLFDEDQITEKELQTCFQDMGDFGFGRDASIGLGKFSIQEIKPAHIPSSKTTNAYLTLAPCDPQGLGYDQEKSYYLPFTRFGKHGDLAVHLKGKPFKNPILLARTGAIFSLASPVNNFLGRGIGGGGELSKSIPETVHQGYCPIIPIYISDKMENDK